VYMDAVEFRQVVLNLALNAADAMPRQGSLVFRVSEHGVARELNNFQGKFPRLPCVCLSVEDNGTGIAAAICPTSSTVFHDQTPHQGLGLGLV